MLMTPLVISLVLNVVSVTCYSDVRRTACMSDFLTEKIPANRSIWSGVIEMHMKCDDGYDFALNTPNQALFRCRPDGKPWTPSYVPDCNKKIVPEKLFVIIGMHMAKQTCQNINTNVDTGKLQLGNPFTDADIGKICGKSRLPGCKLSNIAQVCDGKIVEKKKDFDYWKNELKDDANSPYVVVSVQFDYDQATTGMSLDAARQVMTEDIKTAISWLGDDMFTSKLKAQCPEGSLGIMSENGSLLCRGCSLGFYLDRDLKQCRMCEAGYYMDQTMALKCKICPALLELKDQTTWTEIRVTYDKGSYSLIFCPSLHKNNSIRPPYADIGLPHGIDKNKASDRDDGIKYRSGCQAYTPLLWVVIVAVQLLY